MLIYIVEDEERIRNLESYALEKNGFEVMSFADSGGFYQAMDDRAPDLILLDIMLYGSMTGISFVYPSVRIRFSGCLSGHC